jgi:hypothetical protein
MNRAPFVLPLFNRIVVFIGSCFVVGSTVWMAILFASRRELNIVHGFLVVVFGGLGCFGVWLSLTWRDLTKEPDDGQSSRAHVVLPPEAIVCRFPSLTKVASIIIDPRAGTIAFENCHVPRRFLATSQEWFRCPISEVKGVHSFRYRGESLTIVTAGGKACVGSLATNYEQLRDWLEEAVPTAAPGFATDHPATGMVHVGGGFAGIFAGWYLTPSTASNEALGLFLLAGAVLGVFASHLLVSLADRARGINLARPLGYGVIGAKNIVMPLSGLFLLWSLRSEWNVWWAVAPVAVGFLAGALIGTLKRPRAWVVAQATAAASDTARPRRRNQGQPE